MKILKKLQEHGKRRPLLLALSPLVQIASTPGPENYSLNESLSPLKGPLDDHFSQELEGVLTQYPLAEAPEKLFSLYSEMSSCVARLNAGMTVEPIMPIPDRLTPDFLARQDQKEIFFLEIKTKFRPFEEIAQVLLERLIQSVKNEQKIHSIAPPYHAAYYVLGCDCAASEKPLNILTDSDLEKVKSFIENVFQQDVKQLSFNLPRCPKCQNNIRLGYDSNRSPASGLGDCPSEELSKLNDLILKNIDKAKKQLKTADPTCQLPHVADVYVCLSNSSAGEQALFPEHYIAFEAKLRQEAFKRGVRLDLLTRTGWL